MARLTTIGGNGALQVCMRTEFERRRPWKEVLGPIAVRSLIHLTKLSLLLFTVAPICRAGWCQEVAPAAVEIADEPHHTLLLKNQAVRVFRLNLLPKEATLPHRHRSFYAFVSVRPATIENEVRGRQPALTELKAGELHTSKGGFTVAERNNSPEPAELIVVEALTPDDGKGFGTPMGGLRYHDTWFGELFESSVVRGYTLVIAAGGRVEKHYENYDTLLIALSDLSLHELVDGQPPTELHMKAGEVRWVARGITHATTNVGSSPAVVVTLEFK